MIRIGPGQKEGRRGEKEHLLERRVLDKLAEEVLRSNLPPPIPPRQTTYRRCDFPSQAKIR